MKRHLVPAGGSIVDHEVGTEPVHDGGGGGGTGLQVTQFPLLLSNL